MKTYKGFDRNLKCRDFQYEVGREYEMPDDDIKVCERGFHACESPLEVLGHYFLDDNAQMCRFAEVEQDGKIDREKDSTKVCSSKIKIKAELKFGDLIKAGIEWLKEVTRPEKADDSGLNDKGGDSAKIGSSGDDAKIGSSGYSAKIGSSGYSAQIGSSGYSAQIGSSGDSAQIGSSGDYAQIGSSGYSAQIGSSGDSAKIGSSGDYAKIGSSGDSAQIGSSGDSAKIGSSGDSAQIGSSGDYAKIDSEGEDAVICCAGHNCRVRAKLGSWVTLAEWTRDESKGRWVPLKVETIQIDGEKYLPDTFYKMENGIIVKDD